MVVFDTIYDGRFAQVQEQVEVISVWFYIHFVVQLASLQDFKQSWNPELDPSVAITK